MTGAPPNAVPRWKRLFDLSVALLALVLGFPLLLAVAVLVKLTSPGPVLFGHERYGRGRRRFRLLKFRKMADTVTGGDRVTGRHDYRMTPLGRVLERTKLDELPQLLNVLKGDLSLVGPRPEDPVLADRYPEAFDRILSVLPGVVGPNQIRFRNESELYPADCPDRTEYYVKEILPRKIEVDLGYAGRQTFWGDLWILVRVLPAVFLGILPLSTIRRRPSILVHLAVYPLLTTLSLTLAFLLRFDYRIPEDLLSSYLFLCFTLVPIQTACFFAFGTHQVVHRYFNILDVRRILVAILVGTGLPLLLSIFVQFTSHPRSVFVLHVFLLLVLVVSWKSLFRLLGGRRADDRPAGWRRIRVTFAFAAVATAAFVSAYLLRFGLEGIGFHYPLATCALYVFAVNLPVFYAMQGFQSFDRALRLGQPLELLRLVLVSSGAAYVGAILLEVERNFPRSLILIEIAVKYGFVLAMKYALSRSWSGLGNPFAERERALLVGTLADVDHHFQTSKKDRREARLRLAGVILVGEFHPGMTIHSHPILGEVSQAAEIVRELAIDRLLLLAPEYAESLRAQGLDDDRFLVAGMEGPGTIGLDRG